MVWKLHYWPLLTFTVMLASFVVTYLISVVIEHHVYPLFPYISETGTLSPESCIMGQLFNIGSVSLFITVYIRYKQVEIGINGENVNLNKSTNTVSLWLGTCLAVGISVTGNFQVTVFEAMHILGAFLTFILGVGYFVLQTRISRAYFKAGRTSKYGISGKLLLIRLLISTLLVIMFIVMMVGAIISRIQYKGQLLYYWTEADGGYPYHLVSTFSEWIVAIGMITYIATFAGEFQNIQFEGIFFVDLVNKNNLETSEDVEI